MDEIVAFATDFGSSTHHTQSPNHNLTPITTQPDLTSLSHLTLHPIHIPTQTFHPSIHTHPYTNTYTLTRLIVNKLLTLYITIDILTFMWYNKDNGEGPTIC